MKNQNYRLLTVIVFSLFFIPTSQSQFLKRLQKRVENKVENAVIEKTANKAAEKATNSMDKMFDVNPFGGGGKEKADPAVVANSYDFTWKYSLKMSTKSGDMVFDYYLKPEATYFGFTAATMGNMFTVMDNANEVTIMFMESEGNNVGMVTKMLNIDLETENEAAADYTFETLPEKTINGYHCKGVKIVSDEYEMIMYFTNEAEVSFDDIYKNSKAKMPAKLKDYFDPNEKTLMISMDAKHLKKKNQDVKMECVGLEKVSKTIKKSDYKFM